ncbi:MAG: class I SAM-dependent rRNA methyltransferase [Bacteroidetes bacterium]|nr:class I SAM-dependent rRNA methyltransferase [Bacteroidota bacterium]
MYKKIILKPGKEKSILQKHHWIFSGAIARKDNDLTHGSCCSLYTSEHVFLANGHYHDASIAFRALTFEPEELNNAFFKRKLEEAYQIRCILNFEKSNTNAYRLVHGEGDGLPGLIIDLYGEAAIIQCHTDGMTQHLEDIATALQQVLTTKLAIIYYRHASQKTQSKSIQGFLVGNSNEAIAFENNLQFKINWAEGQKTGFFIDQRDNRLLLSQYTLNKKVLNTFCYTGGFSVFAAHGGATMIHSVDSSAKATILAHENVLLNFPNANHTIFTEDVNHFFKSSNDTYDVIVLDPPAFAKSKEAVRNAMIAYRNLNTEGIKRVSKNGIVFTFSCSQAVDKELFRRLIFQASLQAGRTVRILHELHQPPDHPINIYHPEGEYLKGFVLSVQ